jgi:hypothetical protein
MTNSNVTAATTTTKHPLVPGLIVHASEARALRGTIRDLIRSSNDRAFTGMADDTRTQLTEDLVLASISARAGIRLAATLRGSRVKLDPWIRELLVYDVCMAAWQAGLPFGVRRDDLTVWPMQWLACAVARTLGLAQQGDTLERPMRRTAHYLGARAPDDGIASAWLNERLSARIHLP